MVWLYVKKRSLIVIKKQIKKKCVIGVITLGVLGVIGTSVIVSNASSIKEVKKDIVTTGDSDIL